MNLHYSLLISQEMLSQFYCTILLGLVQRGSHGYYFHQGNPNESRRFTQAMSLGDHAPNNIAGRVIFNRHDQIINKCFSLIRYITDEVWDNNATDGAVSFCKNTEVVLLGHLFKTLSKIFMEEKSKSSHFLA